MTVASGVSGRIRVNVTSMRRSCKKLNLTRARTTRTHVFSFPFPRLGLRIQPELREEEKVGALRFGI
jgi:hypothetical protein